MRAAIYARKSTDQLVADDAKSVTRQIAHGKAFAVSQGWTVDDQHVYVDDGVSGAIFGSRRPGLARLLNALKPRPLFDVLIMSEESRLGREMTQVTALFGQIHRSGVQVYFYLTGQRQKLETAMDKAMLSLAACYAEMEREKASQRSRDTALRQALGGHVTGGRVFGYDNVRIGSYVERRINPDEAAVIREIFALALKGYGYRAIAHRLNELGALAPRPQLNRLAGWAPSSIREALKRPLYRGIVEWDRCRRDSQRRQLKQHQNPDPMRRDAPELRIIAPELAAAVDAIRETRTVKRSTQPGARAIKYILTGLLRCPCGATFEAQGQRHGQRPGGIYLCSAARRKGRAVCSSTLKLTIPVADAEILDAVEYRLLDADLFDEVIAEVVEILSADGPLRGALEQESTALDRELANLALAVAGARGEVATLVKEIRRREARQREIAAVLRAPAFNPKAIERDAKARLSEWRQALRTSAHHAQPILRSLLGGAVLLGQAQRDGVPWRAECDLSGLIPLVQAGTSPAGFGLFGPSTPLIYRPVLDGFIREAA